MLERATHRGVACGSRNLRGGGGGGGDGGGGGGALVSGRLGVLPITPVTDDGVGDEKSSLSPNSSLARSSRELYSAHAPQNPSGSALHHNTPVSLYGTQSFTMIPPPMSNSGKHRLPSCVHFASANKLVLQRRLPFFFLEVQMTLKVFLLLATDIFEGILC